MSTYQSKFDEKIKIQTEIINLISDWPRKLEILKNREDNSLSEVGFCGKYGFNKATFNRIKKGNYPCIPKKSFIDKIESAFEKEGVQ